MWTLKVEYLYIAANFHWNNGRIARFVFWIRHKYKILILSWPHEHLIKSKGAPLQLQPIYLEMAAPCSYTTRAALLAPTIILKWITDQYWPMRGQYKCMIMSRINQGRVLCTWGSPSGWPGPRWPGSHTDIRRWSCPPALWSTEPTVNRGQWCSLLFMIVWKEMSLPRISLENV